MRKTGTRLGLRTDAELRFEKNISPAFSLYALLLFLEELKFYAKDLGHYEIAGIASYIKPELNPLAKKQIEVSWKQMESLIFGEEQEDFEEKAQMILKNLGFDLFSNQVIVPLWRGPEDILIQEDIAEEIARIWGYEKINAQPLLAETKAQPFSEGVGILREIEEMMVKEFHFDQVETYPRVSEQQIKTFGKDTSSLYTLANPLNPEFPYLRDEMSYNLLSICAKNSKFFDDFKLFDLGKVWKRGDALYAHHLDPRYAQEHFCEELHLGACRYEKALNSWSDDPVLKVKTVIQKLIAKL